MITECVELGRGNNKGLEKKNNEKNHKWNDNILITLFIIDIP
jgi:hypothetical protein